MSLKQFTILLLSLLLCSINFASSAEFIPGLKKTVKVVTGDFYPPFIWLDEQGEPVGISVEVIKLLMKKTGLEFKIEVLPFYVALEKVEKGEADMINLIFKTSERQKYLLFSDPIFSVTVNLYYRQDTGLKNKNDISAYVVGAVRGDASVGILQSSYPKAHVVYYDDFETLIKAVRNNEINVFVMEDYTARYYLIKYDLFYRFESISLQTKDLHFAFYIANKNLADLVNKTLKEIDKSELEKITSLFIPMAFRIPPWILWVGLISAIGVLLFLVILSLFNYYLKKLLNQRTLQLVKANEELKAAHEEVRAMNEQLTANNEELEAMNQELNAQNQELNALNEELARKNEELESINVENALLQNSIFDMLKIFSDLLARTSSEKEFAHRVLTVVRSLVSDAKLVGMLLKGPPIILCANLKGEDSKCSYLDTDTRFAEIYDEQDLVSLLRNHFDLNTFTENEFIYANLSNGKEDFGYLFILVPHISNFVKKVIERLGELVAHLSAFRNYVKEEGIFHKRLILFAVKALESYDYYTKGHSENVARYSSMIAERMGLANEDIKRIYWAALVHDIGKIYVPQHVLNKNGILTPEEYQLVKLHSIKGYEWLIAADLPEIAAIVRHHHERFDGKGYPDGLSGETIPILSRIICVADSFDAMTTDRPYRKAFTLEEAKQELLRCSGSQFDPQVVRIMLEILNETSSS